MNAFAFSGPTILRAIKPAVEFHGDNRVRAADLTLEFAGEADLLEQFVPGLRKALYGKTAMRRLGCETCAFLTSSRRARSISPARRLPTRRSGNFAPRFGKPGAKLVGCHFDACSSHLNNLMTAGRLIMSEDPSETWYSLFRRIHHALHIGYMGCIIVATSLRAHTL